MLETFDFVTLRCHPTNFCSGKRILCSEQCFKAVKLSEQAFSALAAQQMQKLWPYTAVKSSKSLASSDQHTNEVPSPCWRQWCRKKRLHAMQSILSTSSATTAIESIWSAHHSLPCTLRTNQPTSKLGKRTPVKLHSKQGWTDPWKVCQTRQGRKHARKTILLRNHDRKNRQQDYPIHLLNVFSTQCFSPKFLLFWGGWSIETGQGTKQQLVLTLKLPGSSVQSVTDHEALLHVYTF